MAMQALELRDQRNTLIDSLSETMKIDVTYGKEDVGAGFTVEKLTIKMVDATTGKPGKTLIDGISRAELETVEGDPNMFLNISELRIRMAFRLPIPIHFLISVA